MTDQPQTYADNVVSYAQAGWPCVLPVPPRDKFPPPVGFTGADGIDTDPYQLVQFASEHPAHSIALRMPDGVIGLDIDHYDKPKTLPDGTETVVQKRGNDTLATYEAKWGQLPATWTSTARGSTAGPGPSRIAFFRAPAQRYATKLDGDVEIIQRHHRYAVVGPSVHVSTGGTYAWYSPDGSPSDKVPGPMDLAELPTAWVTGLTDGASAAGPMASDHNSGWRMLEQLTDDWRPECAHITNSRLIATDELSRADAGSRHDTMLPKVHGLILAAASGHTGVAWSITELRNTWNTLTAGEDRDEEFDQMLHTSARKAVTLYGDHQVPRDPCLLADAWDVLSAAPDSEAGEPGEGIEPPRRYSVLEVIGTHLFNPVAQLDQPLAQSVLERTYPIVRYAYDSRGWLLRLPDRWELHGKDLTEWAVAQVAPLLPVGNPDAEKGSDGLAQHQRRSRFNTQAGARAISSKMGALVAGGTHPCAVRLGDLDNQPDIIWAGGIPWDLNRARHDEPVEQWVAAMDPSTPHLHTAGVVPERRPTPLWDAFLAAVWPDPEIRAWSLRVLSIAATGYPDRALPILLGETGRGKTQVISLLMSVLGSYSHAADPRLMAPAGEKAHASIVFALKGRRMSFIDEGPREGKWAQERLKQLTGGGELTANQMNQNPITFRPTHTLVLTANDEPVLTDPAIRSRARLIPCDGDPELVRVTRAAIGHTNSAAWRAEAPGVLAQIMAEAGEWLADPTSAHVTAAPEALRYLAENLGAEQDPVRVWLEEETEPAQPGTASRELYQAFVASCRRSGHRNDAIPTETKWGRDVTRLGYPATHGRQGKVRGLRLRSGGFLPGMPPAPTTGTSVPPLPVRDGLTPSGDGLVTGSGANPSQAYSQVNPRISRAGDGCDGFNREEPLPCAPVHAHAKSDPQLPQTRHSEQPKLPLTSENDESQPVTPPSGAAKPKRERSPEAVQKASEARETKRQAAISEAAGNQLTLPAVVTRDGTVSPTDMATADALLTSIGANGQALTVDVEHTGYPVGHHAFELRTIQLGTADFAIVLDAANAEHRDIATRALAAAPVLHAHSATADLVPLAHAGIIDIDDAWRRMHDTVVLAKLADPESTGSDSGLKKLATAILGSAALSPRAEDARSALFKAGKWLTTVKSTTDISRSGWANVDPTSETMIRYAASDVLDDAAIATQLPQPDPALLTRELTAHRMTARVADRGLRLDPEHTAAMHTAQKTALTDAGLRLNGFGIENPGSDQQVAAAFERLGAQLPRTKTGRLSVAKGAIDQFAGAGGELGDLVAARLDYQVAENRLGLFLDQYMQLIENGDGRARPTVYTLEAKTGRMSCVRPNLQQVPRAGGFRACITADPGHLLVSADFSGVELRVAAALSQDAALMEILADPERDIHMDIARLVWGPAATKADRYKAKPMVFGRLYGAGAAGLSRDNGVSEAVARSVIDAMDTLTPGLAEWSRQVADGIEGGRTQFRAYSGRTIYMPTDRGYAGPNYCIQGTARELLIDALVAWQDTRWGDAVLLPVHDELVVHVPEADAAEATSTLLDLMSTQLHGVTIAAEASEPSYVWADSV